MNTDSLTGRYREIEMGDGGEGGGGRERERDRERDADARRKDAKVYLNGLWPSQRYILIFANCTLAKCSEEHKK